MFYLPSVMLAGSALFVDNAAMESKASPVEELSFETEAPFATEPSLELALFSQKTAAPSSKSPTPPPPPPHYTSRFTWGADYTHVSFKPDEHTTLNGDLGGVQGLYEYRGDSGFYAGVTLAWKQGNMYGEAPHRSLLYIDTQERIGGHVCLPSMKAMWTFFTGLGYRRLGHDVHSHPSLSLQYNEFYVPVGWEMEYQVTSCFSWDLNFVWMPQFFPSLWIDPGRGANWSLKPRITNFFVEMPLCFSLTENHRWHLDVAPFYEHWEDGQSTAKSSTGAALGIPKNNYEFFGLNLNVSYSF